MFCATVIISVGLVAQARSNEVVADRTGDAWESMDKLVDNFFDWAFKTLPLQYGNLDDTTLSKAGQLMMPPYISLGPLVPLGPHRRFVSGNYASPWSGYKRGDVKDNVNRKKLQGFEARVSQHEYEHLQGVLHIDRQSPTDREKIQPYLGKEGLGVSPLAKGLGVMPPQHELGMLPPAAAPTTGGTALEPAAANRKAQFNLARRVLCATPAALGVFALCSERSPAAAAENFKVDFEVKNLKDGSAGKFTIEVHPDWAPLGAARFSDLLQKDFFSGSRFFQVIEGSIAQFGISGDPAVSLEWQNKKIQDDPVVEQNSRGRLCFARNQPDSRTTQIFINLGDNQFLDKMGYAPFAEIVDGIRVADKVFSGYDVSIENPGKKYTGAPDPQLILEKGNTYLDENFPKLSYIDSVQLRTG